MTSRSPAPSPSETTASETAREIGARRRESHHPARPRTPRAGEGHLYDDCPVCALEAHMIDPSSKPKAGDRDFPAECLINLVLKNLHEPTETRAKICNLVTQWCGSPATWNIRTLVLCAGCYESRVVAVRDDPVLHVAADADTAHGAGAERRGGGPLPGGLPKY